MANKGKGSNKLKRKRGKKFRFFDGENQPEGGKPKQTVENPFEEHSTSKKARSQLIEEFQTRGKNNVFIDKRIGATSSKISEEDKMRLRYLREQRDQLKQTKVSKKRAKYNLEQFNSEDDEEMFMGFTHGGRKLEEADDFQDQIPESSDDEGYDNDTRQGNLDEQMVTRMNFGGGVQKEDKEGKKSRKEIYEEIINKSKAYKMVKSEIKMATQDLSHKLDSEYQDLLPLLNLSKNKQSQATLVETKLDKSYEKIAHLLVDEKRAAPSQVLLTDKEQAKQKKAKLQKLAEQNGDNDQNEEKGGMKKREMKELDKREKAIQRIQKDAIQKYKNDIKSSIVEDKVKEQIKKVQQLKKGKQVEIDSDLASEDDDEEEDYDEEDEEEEDEGSENEEDGDEDDEDQEYGSEVDSEDA
ncbi:nucleolar protein 14 [Stylonychia lemnae]|uniref:Nucleolar protein 14 n=1 Tax=Stylonychia lemnae TaxID=5949 RepID=A0A078A6R1_STYLE|nr:nucleolar protein 14 [Stylonychia lemnae]|eukprot:CDW76429.1 nucleolar protein 14 [Stylonychia lemnae]